MFFQPGAQQQHLGGEAYGASAGVAPMSTTNAKQALPGSLQAPSAGGPTSNGKSLPSVVVNVPSDPNVDHAFFALSPTSQQLPPDQQKKKSVSRSISAFFKNLLSTKSSHGDGGEDGDGVEDDADALPASALSPGAGGGGSNKHSTPFANNNGSVSALPFMAGQGEASVASGGAGPVHLREFASKSFAPQSVAPGLSLAASGSSFSVQSSAKSSTAAIEHEVAAAMRRAQSITGRQHAPSTLLAVNRELPPSMVRPIWNLRDYAIIEKMYTGYASNVYKAFCKHSGLTVCLKSYALGNLCELNRFQIFREVKLHSSLSHENIIKLYGAFQQADQVVLVQEYAESGDLFNLLQKYGGRLSERVAVELVLHPFLAVINYLHTNGIAHRDIKPENILFTGDMRLKLCDFGLAINMREEKAVTRAGTLEYMAPEVLNCPFKNKPEENKENPELHYSFHVDTWAAGVLTYELLVGIPPFSDKQRTMVEDKIRLEMPRFPNKMSEFCRDFITRALEKDPMQRPTVTDMLNHRWIRALKRSASVRQLAVPGSQQEQQQQQQQEQQHLHHPQQQHSLPHALPQHAQQQQQQQYQQGLPQQQQLVFHSGLYQQGSLGSGKLGAGGLSSLQSSMVIKEHEDEGEGATSMGSTSASSPAAPPAPVHFFMPAAAAHGSGH